MYWPIHTLVTVSLAPLPFPLGGGEGALWLLRRGDGSVGLLLLLALHALHYANAVLRRRPGAVVCLAGGGRGREYRSQADIPSLCTFSISTPHP